ncbi:hypothetical protein [Roseovarius tolerans]|uniref:hypothetical protein n=1 Tax=Roseovarius tolerans TaxID=74031 RepID=UPI00111336A1|nr:hypothetical protein [Roseovarius tolerans]
MKVWSAVMRQAVFSLAIIAGLSACQSTVMQTGANYPPISPSAVQVSFASSPNCAKPQEIGLIPQVGSNKYAQDRAINEIKRQAASRGANLVLLKTTATSLVGDMLIDAVMFRCT